MNKPVVLGKDIEKGKISREDGEATLKRLKGTTNLKDFAGNATVIHLRFDVSDTSTLIKDVGRKDLPTILPSITLQALLSNP